MEIKKNLKKILQGDAVKTVAIPAIALAFVYAGWAGLTFSHYLTRDFDGSFQYSSAVSEMKIFEDRNIQERIGMPIEFFFQSAHDTGAKLYNLVKD